MVAAPVTTQQLVADPSAWPDGATAFHLREQRFLTFTDTDLLARGIDHVARHDLVHRPLTQVVPGVLFEGYNILSSPPKIGKTNIAHQLCLAVTTGRDWLGRAVERGPVLFIALEDSLASFQSRERRLLGDDFEDWLSSSAESRLVTIAGDSPYERMATLTEHLVNGCDGQPWRLVLIDTAARFLGAGDARHNAYERGLELMAPLDQLGLRHHCAILGIHHDRKDSGGDDFDAVSGGLSITGTAQSVLSLRRARGTQTGTLSVYPRAAAEQKFGLEFSNGAWDLSPNVKAEIAQLAAGARRDVLTYLDSLPSKAATLTDMVTALPHHTYDNIRQGLLRLANQGLVDNERGIWRALLPDPPNPNPPDPEPPDQVPVTDPSSATQPAEVMAPASAAPDRSPAPRFPEDPGICDHCGGSPCRLTHAGVRLCRTCAPRMFPPQPEETPAQHGAYRRPAWAPDPLAHPITLWNQLLDESFRLKKVQLIGHPYPTDESMPPPIRKRARGRGTLVHEGHHTWRNPQLPVGATVYALDRNGGFLGALASAELPIGAIRERPGRGPDNEVGVHQLDRWPDWHTPDLPHPGGTAPRGKEIWVATATLKLMLQWVSAGELERFTVLRSWTGKWTRLDKLQCWLRDARMAAITAGDTEFEQFLKAVYSLGISTAGESAHNTRLWRPDWNSLLRATHHANMFRAAVRARSHGLIVASVCNTDELHLSPPGGPTQIWECFTHGRGLGEWKPKDTTDSMPENPYQWKVT